MLRHNQPALLLLLLFTLLLAACTPETAGTNPSGSQSSQAPAGNSEAPAPEASSQELVIGIEADAATMLANTDVNYVTDTMIRNLYDPLIDRDKDGKLVPALATEWKNIDPLTWEIKLRQDVKFTNGEPFNAAAVKFNIDYILDEKNNSFYRSRWESIQEVKVVDDSTVHIITAQPFPTLIQRIADDLLIMEPKNVQELGVEKAAAAPVGTGAYTFVSWTRDEKLELAANEEYWRGTPSIKKVTFRVIPEFSARLSAFLSGEIHLFKNIPVDSVDSVKNSENGKIEMIGSSRINYLALNTFHEGPLQDKRVRQALNYAIDVDELLGSVLNGYGTKMTGPLSKVNADYTETQDYGYDPEKAIALLQEANIDPKTLTLQLDTPSGRYPMDTHVAQAIAAQLQRIGITVNVQVNEWGNHLAKIRQHEMKDMFILGWGPAFDAQGTIENLFTEKAPYSSFYDPEVEAMIQKALPIFDPAERKAAFDELQHRLVEEAAWVPLWQQGDLYAVAKSLQFSPRTDEKLNAFEMKWAN